MNKEQVDYILNKSAWFKIEDYAVDYGLRAAGDFKSIEQMVYNGGKLLIAHRSSCFDEVILEVYREHNLNDLSKLDKPVGECIALSPTERWQLAIYLLSTVQVIGS